MNADRHDALQAAAVAERLQKVLGSRPVGFRAVNGGYTNARRSVVTLEDGSSCFIKWAADPGTAADLIAEHRVYGHLRGRFVPKVLAIDPGDPPMLVLEDLSGARRSPPWLAADVHAVREALAAAKAAGRTLEVPTFKESYQGDPPNWHDVARDPQPFLSLRLASESWLERHLPVLLAAAAEAALDGEELLHGDLRSDNMCLSDRGCVLFDWALASRGNPMLDLALWLPSLHAEGGPPPEAILPDQPALAAWTAGFFAAQAGWPATPGAPTFRQRQRTQLRSALPWCVRALGLPSLR